VIGGWWGVAFMLLIYQLFTKGFAVIITKGANKICGFI